MTAQPEPENMPADGVVHVGHWFGTSKQAQTTAPSTSQQCKKEKRGSR
jgi:hypothetical protein